MKKEDVDFNAVPNTPGVYLFHGSGKEVLYVGRATDLQNRIRSYFSDRLLSDRGPRLTEVVEKAERIETIETDTVLDAYIAEANLIKKHQPVGNVADKDNKSFQFVGITEEAFPRVLVVRERQLSQGMVNTSFSHTFGPFPRGTVLKEALRILRKILPFRDTCKPLGDKKCFQAQLGLCPGVCDGSMQKEEYAKRVREVRMFLSGQKKQLIRMLEKEMKEYAKNQEFEKAEAVRRRIFALQHIQDVSLIKREDGGEESRQSFRAEAYDIAHTAGTQTVGVMVVYADGAPAPSEYRVFTIRNATEGDDIGALREILTRRFGHPEWPFPDIIIVDGGAAHRTAAETVVRDSGIMIPVVAVVKTEKHAPREILGSETDIQKHEKEIITANAEAHRFAVARHQKKRSKELFG